MRFCPICGERTHRRKPPGDALDRYVCVGCGRIHYENPKVVVGAVCSLGHRILLCRRAIEPRAGFWTIPAGYLELGESTEEGARREAYEEARAQIRITGLLAVYNVVRIHQVQVLYRAELISGDHAAGEESLETRLFDWPEIPWADLAFPTVHWILGRARELWHVPPPYPAALNPEGVDPPELKPSR